MLGVENPQFYQHEYRKAVTSDHRLANQFNLIYPTDVIALYESRPDFPDWRQIINNSFLFLTDSQFRINQINSFLPPRIQGVFEQISANGPAAVDATAILTAAAIITHRALDPVLGVKTVWFWADSGFKTVPWDDLLRWWLIPAAVKGGTTLLLQSLYFIKKKEVDLKGAFIFALYPGFYSPILGSVAQTIIKKRKK